MASFTAHYTQFTNITAQLTQTEHMDIGIRTDTHKQADNPPQEDKDTNAQVQVTNTTTDDAHRQRPSDSRVHVKAKRSSGKKSVWVKRRVQTFHTSV